MTCTEPTAKRMTSIQYVETLAGHKIFTYNVHNKMTVDRCDVQSKKGRVQLQMSVLAKIIHASGVG